MVVLLFSNLYIIQAKSLGQRIWDKLWCYFKEYFEYTSWVHFVNITNKTTSNINNTTKPQAMWLTNKSTNNKANYQQHKKCDELTTTQAMQPTSNNKSNVTNL